MRYVFLLYCKCQGLKGWNIPSKSSADEFAFPLYFGIYCKKIISVPKIGFWGCFTPFKSLRGYLWNICVSYFSMLDKSILALTKTALEERFKNVYVLYANFNILGFQHLTRSIKRVNDHVLKTVWRSHVSMKRLFDLTGAFHGTFQLVANLMVDAPPCDINRVALSQIIVSILGDRQLRRYPVNAWTSKCHLQQSDKCFVYTSTRRRVATTRVSHHFHTPYVYFYALYWLGSPCFLSVPPFFLLSQSRLRFTSWQYLKFTIPELNRSKGNSVDAVRLSFSLHKMFVSHFIRDVIHPV